MHHPDLEYQILLSMAEERLCGKPVEGLRQSKANDRLRLRLLDKSGNTLILLGSWLKAHSGSPVMGRATTGPAATIKAGT